MSSYDLLSTLRDIMAEIPLKHGDRRLRIARKAYWLTCEHVVEVMAVGPKGPLKYKADNVAEIHKAFDRMSTVAAACIMTGAGFQGPVLRDNKGGFWTPTTDLEYNPDPMNFSTPHARIVMDQIEDPILSEIFGESGAVDPRAPA